MDQVAAVVARLSRQSPDRVRPESRLGDLGLGSSIAIGMLRSRLREELGIDVGENVTWKTRVSELAQGAAADARTASAPPWAPVTAPASQGRGNPAGVVGVGIDVEELDAMPEWGDPFYRDHFTSAELDAATGKEDRRRHLAGIWCVKEAARKASPELAALPFAALEVTTTADGKPELRVTAPGQTSRARFEISISHSRSIATAVVIALAEHPA